MIYTEIDIGPKPAAKADFIDQSKVRLSAESSPSLIVKGKAGLQEITYRDFATTAWGICINHIFFQYRFNIGAMHRTDINGGGDQLIKIGKYKSFDEKDFAMSIFFSACSENDWIYEHDLMMDGSKDYHPTRNLGKTKFCATSAHINSRDPDELLAWINGTYMLWVKELSRLCRPHSTLLEWVGSGLNMGVRCSDFYCEREVKVITYSNLKDYLTSGATLESLRERFVCSTCGRRSPRIGPC